MSSPSPPRILVSGASSFVGSWIVHTLLERGYRVRGSVTDLSKGRFLARIFAIHTARFEYAVVPDIGIEDAFVDALVGVDAVIHTAYPIIKDTGGHPNNVFGPVIRSAVGMLKTIVDFVPTVKRVIFTSSVATIEEPHAVPYVYTEESWNDFAIKHCERNGLASHPTLKYVASKTLAERAAWDFVQNNADRVHFDLVTILPPYILGPSIHQVATPERLQFSTRMIMDALVTEKQANQLNHVVGGYIDVRDLAIIHAEALASPDVAGRRLIASAGSFTWQTLYDALNSIPLTGIPAGRPRVASTVQYNTYQSDIAQRLLPQGQFRSFVESAGDTVINARKIMAAQVGGGAWDMRMPPTAFHSKQEYQDSNSFTALNQARFPF